MYRKVIGKIRSDDEPMEFPYKYYTLTNDGFPKTMIIMRKVCGPKEMLGRNANDMVLLEQPWWLTRNSALRGFC